MARIQDLPFELTHELLCLINPEDVEKFASTCRQIQAKSATFLEEHRARIRKYGVLKVQRPYRDGDPDPRVIANTLKDVLTVPRLGGYVRSIRVNNVDRGSTDIIPAYIAESFTVFAQAVQDSEFLKEALLKYPEGQLERGDEDILLALLVPLLPNLNKIIMPHSDSLLLCLLHVITEMPRVCPQRMSRLSKVWLIKGYGNGYYTTHFDELMAYAKLPSLRQLSVHGLRVSAWVYGYALASNLSTLTLWRCSLETETLSSFIKTLRLERFAYALANASNWEPVRIDLSPVVEALLANSETTLQTLVLDVSKMQRPVKLAVTFERFKTLKDLHTDWYLLLEKVSRPADVSVARTLPTSLTNLYLNDVDCLYIDEYQSIVKAAVLDRECGRNQLQGLFLSGHTDWPAAFEWEETIEMWRERCEAAGITLSSEGKAVGSRFWEMDD